MSEQRSTSFGQGYDLTPVDKFGIWLSHRQIRRWVPDLRAKRVGDFGCGFEARLTRSLLGDVAHATLADVALSDDLKRDPKVTALEGALPGSLAAIPDGSLDVVFCLSVLEHLDDPKGALAHIRRVLAPGGVALLNVPSWLGKPFLEFSAFQLGLSPANEMEDHKAYYDPKDLWPMLVAAGFKPSQVKVWKHKFGLNTFAVCRAEGGANGNAGVKPPQDWEQHWTAYDEATQRNPAHRYRRKLVFDAISSTANGTLKILDLGCGTGEFLSEVKARFPNAELAGIDFSQAGLDLAAKKAPGVKLSRGNFESEEPLAPELAGWATHVVCSEVLEHLDQPALALRHARKLLAPGGRLVVTVPGGPRSAFDVHIGHRRHYAPEDLEALAREAGFVPEKVEGAGFPFFNAYKLAVIARGKKLVNDVDSAGSGGLSKPALLAMDAFDKLFAMNRDESKRGWQTFGVFRAG